MKLLIRNTLPHSFVSDAYTPSSDELLVPALPRLQLSDYTPAIIANQLPAKEAGLFCIKVQAKEMIDELQWRLERAQERETIGAEGETVEDVLRDREAVRRASNRAEDYINNSNNPTELRRYSFEVLPSDYP